jgi:mRNA-degrading endonuclease toxin of MazEF toxin-antitoxin module
VLLLIRDDAYGVLNKFVAAEITATIRHIPIEVPLGKAEGMPKPCVVNCDNLRTISKVHPTGRISRIPARRIREVKRAVGYALA